jgi:hypothetical protein
MSIESLFKEDTKYHTVIMGSSGKGRSVLIQNYADKNGISYEEAERHFEPSKEQLETRRVERKKREELALERLNKVKLTYWEVYQDDNYHFDAFESAIRMLLPIDEVSMKQVKEIFMMIPDNIFGNGISWGFGDSEVRNSVYEFVEDNLSDIFKTFVDKNLMDTTDK